MTDHLLVLPGGGYHRHAPHEGEPVAAWLRGLGLGASVFAYPVKTRHPAVLDAVRGEIRRVRDAGAQRVGLVGFSAGGHAAAMAAADADLVILGYPVISMQLPTHKGSRDNLLGTDPTPEERAATSADLRVTASHPPHFLWHSAADAAVPPQHSYLLGQALAEHGVRHALHVFPLGVHGLGLAEGSGAAARWTSLCEEWLRDEGWVQ